MACSTDSRVNHYDCSTGFSSSEQREVSLHIKRRFSCRPVVNKKTLNFPMAGIYCKGCQKHYQCIFLHTAGETLLNCSAGWI